MCTITTKLINLVLQNCDSLRWELQTTSAHYAMPLVWNFLVILLSILLHDILLGLHNGRPTVSIYVVLRKWEDSQILIGPILDFKRITFKSNTPLSGTRVHVRHYK